MEKIIILIREELEKKDFENLKKQIKDFLGENNVMIITDPSEAIEIHKIKIND